MAQSLSSPQRLGACRRNNDLSRAYLLLATSVMLVVGASAVEGAAVRKLLQLPLLGGLIPSLADTPAGEQHVRYIFPVFCASSRVFVTLRMLT